MSSMGKKLQEMEEEILDLQEEAENILGHIMELKVEVREMKDEEERKN